MLRTKAFDFDRSGNLTFYQAIDARMVVKICTDHARETKTKKPCRYRFIPTLTARV